MAVRPPSGDADEPEAIEFGIAALDARIDEADVEFPATDEAVLAALESTAVPYDAAGHTLDLSKALDRVPSSEFESETELLDELYPVFEQRRRGTTFVERVRGLLPF
ncbi:MAG: hypothetical protein ABEH81_00535 [Halopenitus sp.]